MLRHIPNAFTSLNLLSGCIGLAFVTSGNILFGAYAVWIGGFFDFLDGFSARMIGVESNIGKEHDSLADMVTFGVLPSFVVYTVLTDQEIGYAAFIGFSIAIFSALRLAKFNVDKLQRDVFIGVPTPANALFFTGLTLPDQLPITQYIVQSPWILITVTILASLLMVSPFRFIALKFNGFKWSGNEWKFVFIGISLIILLFGGLGTIPVVMICYVVTSLTENLLHR